MRDLRRSCLLAAFLATPLAGVSLPVAHAQVLDPIQYELVKSSHLEYGCMGPCACPVIMFAPVTGGFTFYRTGVDPLFSHYALLNIAWDYAAGPSGTGPIVHLTGQGTYDIGGEVAAMQRMTLDLTVDDPRQPPFAQHFDSGLVPVRASFPAIDIDVHRWINTCLDSVIRVTAAPLGLVGVTPGGKRSVLRSVSPNPTRSGVEVLLTPSMVGRVQVEVVDLSGRRVCTLADDVLGPGELRLRWDGRDARGADVGSGLYWIRVRAAGHSERSGVIRLK